MRKEPDMRKPFVAAGSLALAGLWLGVFILIGAVIDKEDPPASLTLNVRDVPYYVYLGKPYTLTIDYTNDGVQESGPMVLTVEMRGEGPFDVLSVSDAGRVDQSRVQWALPSVPAQGTGSVQLTIKGLPPEDLSYANYNKPGFAGYAAFENGFKLSARAARASDGDLLGTALALADSGAQVPTQIQVTKDFTPDPSTNVTVEVGISCTVGTGSPSSNVFSDEEQFTFGIVGLTGGTTDCTLTETNMPAGYEMDEDASTCDDGPITVAFDTVEACVFANRLIQDPCDPAPTPRYICVFKDAVSSFGGSFDFDLEVGGSDEGGFSLGDGDFEAIPIASLETYVISEQSEPGWQLVSISCEDTEDVVVVTDIVSRTVRIEPFLNEASPQAVCTFVNLRLAPTPRPNLSGVLIGPGRQPTAQPAAATSPVRPPSTGDGGLAGD
jgi:hypothetical protein